MQKKIKHSASKNKTTNLLEQAQSDVERLELQEICNFRPFVINLKDLDLEKATALKLGLQNKINQTKHLYYYFLVSKWISLVAFILSIFFFFVGLTVVNFDTNYVTHKGFWIFAIICLIIGIIASTFWCVISLVLKSKKHQRELNSYMRMIQGNFTVEELFYLPQSLTNLFLRIYQNEVLNHDETVKFVDGENSNNLQQKIKISVNNLHLKNLWKMDTLEHVLTSIQAYALLIEFLKIYLQKILPYNITNKEN